MRGGIVREFGVVMYPLLYLKCITNKDYCITQETLLNVMWQPGCEESLVEWICAYVWEKRIQPILQHLVLHSGGWVSTLLSLNLTSQLNFHFLFNWHQGISTGTFFSTIYLKWNSSSTPQFMSILLIFQIKHILISHQKTFNKP